MSTETPGRGKRWRRQISVRELLGLTFIKRAIVQTVKGKRKSEIYHYAAHKYKVHFLSNGVSVIMKDMCEMDNLVIP